MRRERSLKRQRVQNNNISKIQLTKESRKVFWIKLRDSLSNRAVLVVANPNKPPLYLAVNKCFQKVKLLHQCTSSTSLLFPKRATNQSWPFLRQNHPQRFKNQTRKVISNLRRYNLVASSIIRWTFRRQLWEISALGKDWTKIVWKRRVVIIIRGFPKTTWRLNPVARNRD